MAMLALLFQREFCKCLAKSREVKQRVVSETLRPAGNGKQFSGASPVKVARVWPSRAMRNHADIFSRISILIQSFQLRDERGIVGLIVRVLV